MRQIGIVAYKAHTGKRGVIVDRVGGCREDRIETADWEELADFLAEDFGIAIHICWRLYYFADAICSILPRGTQQDVEDKTKVFIGNTKIYSTDRLLGITTTRHIEGNFYRNAENNFYGLSRWLPPDIEVPDSAQAVEKLGYDLLDGLEKLGIYSGKLTSPIGLFAEKINPELLPTIFNAPDSLMDAMDYAEYAAKYEWRKKFSRKKEGYHFDLTSAYPYFISNLPDTRHGTMSRKRGNHQWGIVKAKVIISDTTACCPIDKNAKYFTTEEIDWVESHNLGTFEIEDGYYFNFNGGKPYKTIVDRLIGARRTDDTMVAYLAKRMAQGLSGYLDQYNKDGSFGMLYNPILASMVRSRCRLAVADFIYENALCDSLIEVNVDGVTAGKKLVLPTKSKPGKWRLVE